MNFSEPQARTAALRGEQPGLSAHFVSATPLYSEAARLLLRLTTTCQRSGASAGTASALRACLHMLAATVPELVLSSLIAVALRSLYAAEHEDSPESRAAALARTDDLCRRIAHTLHDIGFHRMPPPARDTSRIRLATRPHGRSAPARTPPSSTDAQRNRPAPTGPAPTEPVRRPAAPSASVPALSTTTSDRPL